MVCTGKRAREAKTIGPLLVLLLLASNWAAPASRVPEVEVTQVTEIGVDSASGRRERTLVARCASTLRADRAVLFGAMTASGARPGHAVGQIEKQLAEVQKYAVSIAGQVTSAERVRAVRAAPEQADASASAEPFVALQRIELDLPASVDIDWVLERVTQLGIDRFGRGVNVEYLDANPKIAVQYRFSQLVENLDQVSRGCVEKTLDQWCSSGKSYVCDLPRVERHRQIALQRLSLESQPILREHGRLSRLEFHYPWYARDIDDVLLLSNTPIRLQGELQLQFDVPAE
jgi:hypothetical protein